MCDKIKLVVVCLVLVGLLALLGVAGQAEAADKAPTIVQLQAVVKAVMPGTFWFNGPCSVVLLPDGTYRATNERGDSTILDPADPQNPFRFRSRATPGWGVVDMVLHMDASGVYLKDITNGNTWARAAK